MTGSRAFAFAAACLCLIGVGAAAASTPALVIDASSGRVLFSDRATEPWFPASITKLMTTYVALDLVRSGQLSMDSLLTLSSAAAAQPPSKMAFRPGTQLTLDNALKIIMVKSANDIAWMIGENLGGGSMDAFAGMMNAQARRLGMRDSRWVNANGLPDERQHTTARDMAILARALLTEFPEHEPLFHIGALKLGRQIIRNHNGMLGRYPGADGMKTGFICSGGFNMVATATQNGRKLIAVVFGYPSARERDLRAADLLDQGFTTSGGGWSTQRVEDLPPSLVMSPPDMRSSVCGPHRRHPEADDEQAVVATGGFGSGNADNPIAALFSRSAFSRDASDNTAISGGRRSLGPRVAFEPIPVWIGASPGAVADGADGARAIRSKIAAQAVKTKLIGRRPGAVPASAQAFTAPAPILAAGDDSHVETLATRPQPAARPALRAGLASKPVLDETPKGAAAPQPRRKLGAIEPKPSAPLSGLNPSQGDAPRSAASPKPGSAKSPAAAKPAAKPGAKTAKVGAAETKTAAKPATRPKPEPARSAKPAGRTAPTDGASD